MDDLFGAAQAQSQMMQNQFGMQGQMIPDQFGMQGQMMPNQFGMQNQMMPNQFGMQGQMMSPYSMQQAYQTPMGSTDRYGNIRYSKYEYLEGLRNYIIRNCGFNVTINKEEKLEDLPQRIRHCCVNSKSKIVMLDKLTFSVPETGMNIPFYFCRDCGKLYYYKDFMM